MVASPEDLIVYKTLSAAQNPERLQDVLDVKAVFRRMGKDLDTDYLRRWSAFWESQGVEGVMSSIEELIDKWSAGERP